MTCGRMLTCTYVCLCCLHKYRTDTFLYTHAEFVLYLHPLVYTREIQMMCSQAAVQCETEKIKNNLT